MGNFPNICKQMNIKCISRLSTNPFARCENSFPACLAQRKRLYQARTSVQEFPFADWPALPDPQTNTSHSLYGGASHKIVYRPFFAYLFCAAEVLRYYALRAAFHLPGKYSLRRGASVKGDTDRHRTHWKNMLLFMQPFAEKNAPALRRGGTRKLRLADEAFQHRTERSGCNIVSVN